MGHETGNPFAKCTKLDFGLVEFNGELYIVLKPQTAGIHLTHTN